MWSSGEIPRNYGKKQGFDAFKRFLQTHMFKL